MVSEQVGPHVRQVKVPKCICSMLCHAARLGGDILPDEVMIPLVILLYDCRCRIPVAFTMSVKQDCLWDKTIAARAQHGLGHLSTSRALW